MGILTGKTAIVTGAGQGIGEAAAIALAKEGAAIAAVGRTFAKVERTAKTIEAIGGRALAVACDIARRDEVDAAVAATVKEFGTVGIVVNNAAVMRFVPFEQATEADLQDAYDSAVKGTFNFMQACFPYLKAHGGKIINFGSAAGTEGLAHMATYAASKEAVRGLTKCVAVEWGKYGININVICPVAVTPAWEAEAQRVGPEGVARYLDPIPMRRMGDAEKDIGRVVVFLAGPDSDYITGRTLHVDGGRAMFR